MRYDIYIYIYVIGRLKVNYKTLSRKLHETFFENELFPPTAIQQRQHADVVGCRAFFFSGLISMFVFDILQIPRGFTHATPPHVYRSV